LGIANWLERRAKVLTLRKPPFSGSLLLKEIENACC
jgi:hypothetical protein